MIEQTAPSDQNQFLSGRVTPIRNSFRHFLQRELVPASMTDVEAARFIYESPWVLVAHDNQPDPVFYYANKTAQGLFAMTWNEMMTFPSRLTVERSQQGARERLLQTVAERGFAEHYDGIRIGRHGHRFEIKDAVIFNVLDEMGQRTGQAALFETWNWLD